MRLILALLALGGCASTRTTTVRTDRGPIVGLTNGGVQDFRGIPYAAPPVGELRWKPPVPMLGWATPRDARKSGPACPQPSGGGLVVRETSEDCLTLDVTAPVPAADKLPVLVWIHGGAFHQGSGSDALHDRTRLAARAHAVVVTLNYRLGPLGFLSHRELAREMRREVSPSFGILDQRAALDWVRRNIAEFGGDPTNVTLFGESAGAASVCTHLASPNSHGLFARAIMQSGVCSGTFFFDAKRAEAQGAALATAVGCSGEAEIACLRSRSSAALAKALPLKRGVLLSPGVWWGPVVDGIELPRVPLAAMRSGDFAHVPVIIGWNKDEGVLFTHGAGDVAASEVAEFARQMFGERAAPAVMARYARGTPKKSLTDMVTDGIFACDARRTARVLTAQGVPAFLYEWQHPLDDPKAHPLGATHTVDLFFVWGPGDTIELTERERPLSEAVMKVWGRFALTGSPADRTLVWPRHTVERDEHLRLDLVISAGSHPKRDECDFWDGLP
jgi:para-nitrobenzyl esterase